MVLKKRSKKTAKKTKRSRKIPSARARRTARLSEAATRYVCDACNFNYIVSEQQGVLPEDQPAGWACPRCSADRDHFQIVVPSDRLDEPNDDEVDDIDVSDRVLSGSRLATIKNTNPDVSALVKRWKRGILNLQPNFQRYDVWTDKIRSALVESILLQLPIPTIYLAEMESGEFVVVDGQQRLTAIFRFLDNQYCLTGLTALRKFNGKAFADLGEDLQRLIEDRALDVTEIFKETDANVKFSLFERLNRGSVKLNDQELRNSVYRGTYNDFVVRLADHPVLKEALNIPKGKRHQRMVDSELTLRFLAFYDQTYLKHPDKKTSEFLNHQMDRGRLSTEKTLQQQEKAFNDALTIAHSIYGDKMFRRFRAGDAEDPNGQWEPRINRALMDVVLYWFARYSKQVLTNNSDVIREKTLDLMGDEQFVDLITHTISAANRVKRRFEMFDIMLEDACKDIDASEVRLYSKSVKRDLYASNNCCVICKNDIVTIDDAHVDHVKPFSKGGKTSLGNAALTHRFCNQSAGAKSSKTSKKPR